MHTALYICVPYLKHTAFSDDLEYS
eukprot:SAG31_NODE_45607_length_258_cov_0.647799_1_plen_24_part_10